MRIVTIAFLLVPWTVEAQEPPQGAPDSVSAFTIVETMPQFPGGEAALF